MTAIQMYPKEQFISVFAILQIPRKDASEFADKRRHILCAL